MNRGYMYDENKNLIWDDGSRKYLTPYEIFELLNEKDEKISDLEYKLNYLKDYSEHLLDIIKNIEFGLEQACSDVFDETLPYEAIQEMKLKHGKNSAGVYLEDVEFYYKNLKEDLR